MKKWEKVTMTILACFVLIAAAQWWAIQQAESYTPPANVACFGSGRLAISLYTAAVHKFSGCVPPGWLALNDGAQ